ncbi:phosphopantetheine-binding protein [Aestuariivirga litoralis]|uniref:phosphopantetheine-binding protein n=1 Tax=Aestuariivirga litoralis TaxID=2650924 RepID=UPI0018C456FF|nr:phosphopantetheine-binding protein [Aestuariivirga litoralis]MBG1232436.1 phosphopantetheine-binding protein [Aestuariivirga litoralis]
MAENLNQETVEKIMAIVAKEGLIDPSKLSPDATLESLGIKSADMVMILMAIEEQFGAYIPIDGPLSEAKTVKDFMDAIAPHLKPGAA